MASPWSFLTRLVSPRRQKKQDDGSSVDVKPNELAIAGSTDTPDKESFNLADQPTRKRTHPLPQSEPAAAEAEPLAKTGSDIQVLGKSSNSNMGEQTSDPSLPHLTDSGAYAAPRVDETIKAPASRSRAKKIDAVVVVTQPAPVVPTISDEMSLDQEIRALRGQLATKLRLQNTKLKQMLERFER